MTEMSIHNLISTVFQDSSCLSRMPLVTGNLPAQLECFKPTPDVFSADDPLCFLMLNAVAVAVGMEVLQFDPHSQHMSIIG